jgi:hypothetical protein
MRYCQLWATSLTHAKEADELGALGKNTMFEVNCDKAIDKAGRQRKV